MISPLNRYRWIHLHQIACSAFYVLSHEKMVFGQWFFISLSLSNLVTILALLFLAEQEMSLSCAEMDVVFTSTDIKWDT